MKIFVDEDTGSRLGRALEAVDVDVWYVAKGKRHRIQPGTWDENWIPLVSGDGRLILTRNTQMLDSPLQRQLLLDNRSAILYLPAHFTSLALLQLVMKKWSWIESIFDNEPRPFAYRFTGAGFPIPVDLTNYVARRPRGMGRRRRASPVSIEAMEPRATQPRLPTI